MTTIQNIDVNFTHISIRCTRYNLYLLTAHCC